jgi:hypothetical protein
MSTRASLALSATGAATRLGPGATACREGALVPSARASISRQNTRIDLTVRETELPTAFRFSVGSNLYGDAESLIGQGSGTHRLNAEVALTDGVDLAAQVGVGVEYSFSNYFFARGGKKFYNDERSTGSSAKYGLSGGFGVRLPISDRDVRFDYSYTSLGDLQNIQIFSFEFGR